MENNLGVPIAMQFINLILICRHSRKRNNFLKEICIIPLITLYYHF